MGNLRGPCLFPVYGTYRIVADFVPDTTGAVLTMLTISGSSVTSGEEYFGHQVAGGGKGHSSEGVTRTADPAWPSGRFLRQPADREVAGSRHGINLFKY